MDNNKSAIQVFEYDGSRQVRTVEKDGEMWFVAKDVCDILEHTNARKAVKSLDDDEKSSVTISYGTSKLGGNPNMVIVNEPGLYKLIFKSRKTEAKNFTRWVTHEVLPSIRKTGAYAVNGDIQNHIRRLEAENKLLHEKVDSMLEQLEADRSFAVLGKVVSLQNGVVSFSEAGKLLAQNGIKIGPNGLLKKGREKGVLCKCKGRRWNQPTQKAIKDGLCVLAINVGYKGTPFLTAKGLQFFSDEYVGQFFPLLALIEGGEAVNA